MLNKPSLPGKPGRDQGSDQGSSAPNAVKKQLDKFQSVAEVSAAFSEIDPVESFALSQFRGNCRTLLARCQNGEQVRHLMTHIKSVGNSISTISSQWPQLRKTLTAECVERIRRLSPPSVKEGSKQRMVNSKSIAPPMVSQNDFDLLVVNNSKQLELIAKLQERLDALEYPDDLSEDSQESNLSGVEPVQEDE